MDVRRVRRAALAAATVGGIRVARSVAATRTDRRFMRIEPGADRIVELGVLRFRLPATWLQTDGFGVYFAADLESVQALMPSPLLHPARVDGTHALVAIAAFRHLEATARAADGSTLVLPRYGEVAIVLPVTRRPMPPLAPMVLGWMGRPLPGYVLHLPVTSRLHRDGGRAIWGLPKFVADMAFAEDGTSRSVHLHEAGRTILDLEVDLPGSVRGSRAPSVMYGVRDGRLIEVACETRTVLVQRLRPRGSLELGDHPVARQLAGLGLSPRPVAGALIVRQRFAMPEGRDLGAASAPARYEGRDIPHGIFTSRTPDGAIIDHDAPALGHDGHLPTGRGDAVPG